MTQKKKLSRIVLWLVVALAVSVAFGSCGGRRKAVEKLTDVGIRAADEMRIPVGSDLRERIRKIRADASDVADTVVAGIMVDVADSLLSRKEYGKLTAFVNEAFPPLKEIAGESKRMQWRLIELKCHAYEAYRYMGLYDRAAKGMLSDIALAERLQLKEGLALLYNNLSTLYKAQGVYDEATRMGERSVKMNEALKDSGFLVINYNNLASIHLDKKDYHKAIEYSFLSLHYIPSRDSLLYMMVQRNISTKYAHLSEYGMASKLLLPVMRFFERTGNDGELPYTYARYAFVLWKTGDVEEAGRYYGKAFAMIGNSLPEQQRSIARSYAEFCEATGDRGNELAALKKCLELAESVDKGHAEDSGNALASLYRYELDTSDRNVDLMRENRRATVAWAIALSSVFVLAVMAFVLVVARSRRRMSDLRGRLDESRHQLYAVSVESARNNELITKMSRELQKLQHTLRTASKSESLEGLRSLTSEVMRNEKREKDNAAMNVANADFFKHILERYPMLTPNDLRLAAMLRQGLSSKEIADAVLKEVRSVETARNRLRKKMGIPSDVDLCKFFMQV